MNYKDTLLMPNTKFEMRGNLNEKDPKFISVWKNKGLYELITSRESEEFILHDGPPYANGDIHIGHALNKIIKDFIIRNAALEGKKINWITGWDTHGLPIETKVQQSGIKLSEVGKNKYLEACFNYANSQVKIQEEQFKQLALLTNFDNKYLTLDKEFESKQISVFHKMLNQNLVYQDLKPVYWSWSSKTALAEAEIEYKDSSDYSIYVKFKHENSDVNFLIWTTTPWTLPANVAISFGEKIKYSLVELNEEKIIIADELIKAIFDKQNSKYKIIKSVDMNDYKNDFAINPLNQKKSKIVIGHHVTTDSGTGLVHIAGGHGNDDYIIVKENDLELIVVQDDNGHMINSEEYNGMFYLKANKLIANKLETDGDALFVTKFIHSIPIDWRTKEPVIYRATKQWFVSIDPIKNDLINEIKKVNWLPSWGEGRLIGMTENRNDWCVSRQRLWGVPIPIIYDECGNPIIDTELQKNIEKKFELEGMMAWHNTPIKDLLPKHIEFNNEMTKETDILDVWFDSGASNEVLNGKKSDVVVEGNDQYRGWFNSSLINSFVSKGCAPYKTVITHGFVTDQKGNKMSKSIGNTISPIEITSMYGADILRLWVANSDYQDNPKISDQSIKQISNDYRTIRNTIRFILGSIDDFDDSAPELNLVTKSILNELGSSLISVREKIEKYNYNHALKEIMNQLNNGAIKYLLDYSKDSLYILEQNNSLRRGIQFALKEALKYLLFATAIFIPITIEEAYEELTKGKGKMFFENTYPDFIHYKNVSPFSDFLKIRNEVNKSVELLRSEKIIQQSVEASINLSLPDELKIWSKDLKGYLMIAELNITDGKLKSIPKKFIGDKCQRCWKFFKSNEMKAEICKQCYSIIKIEK